MKKLVAVLCVGALAGCATFGDLDRGVASLVGKPSSAAFSALGYPASQQKFGDDTVYVWTESRSSAVFMPTTTNTYGQVGGTPYSGTTTGMQAIPLNGQCVIKLGAGPDGVIKNYDWNGNRVGCEGFMRRMKAYTR